VSPPAVKTARAYDQSLANFAAWLRDQYTAGKIPVLMVDEAQNLNLRRLRLIHFLLDSEASLELALGGDL
jgi:hypothetical protein